MVATMSGENVWVFTGVVDIKLFNVRTCVANIRTSVSNNVPHFSIMKLPSATIDRDHREIHSTVGGGKFSFPPSHVAVGLTPTSVGGRKPVCSLPVLVTVLGSAKRLSYSASDSTFLKRLSLGNRIHEVGNILPVIVGTRHYNIGRVCVPTPGTTRNTIIHNVAMCPMEGIKRLLSRLANKRGVAPISRSSFGSCDLPSGLPSFSSIGNRRRTGETLRITTTNKRGIVVVKPPNSNGDVLTGHVPSVLPSVAFRRSLRAAGVCSMTKILPGKVSLVGTHPFHSPRRAISPTKLSKNNAMPHPNRVSLTRGNMLFLSRLPRFSEASVRILHRPVRSNGVAVTHITTAFSCPYDIVLMYTVGPYPYNCFKRPAEGYAYPGNTPRGCLSEMSNPLLSELSVRVRIPPISFSTLSRGRNSRRYSSRVGTEIGGTERVRHHHFGKAGIAYGTGVSSTLAEGCYVVAATTTGVLQLSFSGLNLSTETCSGILEITEAVTSLSNDSIVSAGRVTRTMRCEDLSQGF